MHIIVDMDNTLNDFLPTFLARIPEGKRTKDWHKPTYYALTPYIDDTIEGCNQFINETYADPSFWGDMKPATGAWLMLEAWVNAGHTLQIATALPPRLPEDTLGIIKNAKLDWLNRYFPYLFSEVTFTSEKWLLKGDIIIDDHRGAVISHTGERFAGRWWMPKTTYNLGDVRKCNRHFSHWPSLPLNPSNN